MLRSMTGFGRGEASGAGVSVVVELRSVNHRYLDVVVRGPREYISLEPQVQRVVKAAFRRGRIEAHIRRQPRLSEQTVAANAELFRAYNRAIDELLGADVEPVVRAGAIGFVLSQPSVLSVTTHDVDVMAEVDVLMVALDGAIADLGEMRDTEGRSLEEDLVARLLELLGQVDGVGEQVDGLNERLHARIEQRVRKLLGDRLEPWRIVQEAAMLAERSDVAEELARLRSHVLQFKDALERELDEAVGRRLDFLLQEMNREVNTIGSKAAEHPVSHRVVEMKAILERMREQAANVE